jgi:hypothetical protein
MKCMPPERILEVGVAAISTEIVSLLLIDVVADAVVLGVIEAVENVLDLLQVIALVFDLVLERIEGSVDFDADYISEFAFRIN